VITHVADVNQRLQKATEFARKNLKSAQGSIKTWYNRKARQRSFKPGNKVLALLPIHGRPLLWPTHNRAESEGGRLCDQDSQP